MHQTAKKSKVALIYFQKKKVSSAALEHPLLEPYTPIFKIRNSVFKLAYTVRAIN